MNLPNHKHENKKHVTRLSFVKKFCKNKTHSLPYPGEQEKDFQQLMSAAHNSIYGALHYTGTLCNS